jgi:SNF2 family DNA or RNA helicase
MNMWAISPPFREEFVRSDKSKFNDRYGYRKRLLQDRDEEGSVVEFGSMSDRVTRSNRVIGNAPGVLPLFLLRHLLPISVTLHKADLALELPPCTQERELIDPDPELLKRYRVLQTKLIAQIRKDQFNPELAGKLFGQLAELPSYLDRATADTGNTEEGDYTIRYPESVGNEVVATQPPLPASEVLPKEEWLLRKVQQELSEGRNVLVFSWHTSLLQRYARLISDHIDQKVPILYANKVGTAKRQEWITKQVVKKGVRVLVTNPIVIQTGLNNLVHFATELWMENPACNPIIYRQAVGRVDRIGQRIPTRIFSPIYAGTLQQQLYDLLLQKVAVSVSTDGLDPESALLAAGIGTDAFMTGLSIGKQLWAMLSEGFTVNRAYGQL